MWQFVAHVVQCNNPGAIKAVSSLHSVILMFLSVLTERISFYTECKYFRVYMAKMHGLISRPKVLC